MLKRGIGTRGSGEASESEKEMDVINRIGHYFAQHEIQLRQSIAHAVESTVREPPSHLRRCKTTAPQTHSHRAQHLSEEISRHKKLTQQYLTKMGIPETIVLDEDHVEAEHHRAYDNVSADSRRLLDMYELERQRSEDLFDEAADAVAEKKVSQRRKERKKSRSKKSKSSSKKAKKSQDEEALAIAAKKKLQAERQEKIARSILAIQERAKQIQLDNIRKRQEAEASAKAEKLRIDSQLQIIDKIRKLSVKKSSNAKKFKRSPRVDPKTRFTIRSSFSEPEESIALNEKGASNQESEPAETELELGPFLSQLELQQRDQMHFETHMKEKRRREEEARAAAIAQAELEARILAKEKAAAEKKELENQEMERRLAEILRRKEQAEKSFQELKYEESQIRTQRYAEAREREEKRKQLQQRLERELSASAAKKKCEWEKDEYERSLAASEARLKAVNRLKTTGRNPSAGSTKISISMASSSSQIALKEAWADMQAAVRECQEGDTKQVIDDDQLFLAEELDALENNTHVSTVHTNSLSGVPDEVLFYYSTSEEDPADHDRVDMDDESSYSSSLYISDAD